MRWVTLLTVCVATAACVAPQPESARTVAAFEVPLWTEEDRSEFIAVLRIVADAHGMHIDAASSQELERRASVAREFEHTISAGIWLGSDDDEFVGSIRDYYPHLGQVWITFSQGTDPDSNGRFREDAMREIRLRWPETLSLPIMPSGAIPLHRDLIKTEDGYVVDPSAASKYSGFR